jgi:hypothetical protein
MSDNGLLSGSPEILIQIVASCNAFAQVVALSSTCRYIQVIWISNASAILDRVARKCIPTFDEAVVAVGDHDPFPPHVLSRSSC